METNSWPERVLACHIYCDTAHPFIWKSPMTNDTHTCCLAFSNGVVTTCFNNLGLLRPRVEHQTFRMRGERSNRLRLHMYSGQAVVQSTEKFTSVYISLLWYSFFQNDVVHFWQTCAWIFKYFLWKGWDLKKILNFDIFYLK